MKTEEIIEKSVEIVTEYYKNNLEPFFEHMSEDVYWLGPAEHQAIEGKQNLMNTFGKEDHGLRFVLGDIDVKSIAPTANVREILLHYDIYTYYPSGNMNRHDQRITFTWREKRFQHDKYKKTVCEICMISISNLWKYDARDTIYPVHYEAVMMPEYFSKKAEQFITVKASNMSLHRLSLVHILYIETIKRSAKVRIHTLEGELSTNTTLQDLEAAYPGYFVRIHASYLVNPDHIEEIRRFAVKLTDGTELPIPEKKYTRVKKELLSSRTPQ